MAHRYTLEMLTPDGERLRDVALEKPDFARAVEATFFDALRDGRLRDYAVPPGRVTPSAPGFEVSLPTPAGEVRRRFGLDYFRSFARRAGVELVLGGELVPSAVLYRLSACADEPSAKPRRLAFDLSEEESTIPIREGSLGDHGPREAWGEAKPGEFPVLFPRHIIEESVAEARRVPDREVGGALLGHLRRDRETDELYLEVTCLVPCEETHATEVSVTFTHETWARVREVAAWRGESELIVGWVHSHPFRLCAECPSPVAAECRAKVLFYSGDDEFLMELTFPRPFMVGLLAAVEPRLGELPVQLYGWKNGKITPRGFDVIDG